MKNKKKTSVKDGILLYAKTPGITSFSSLWDIKHALDTDKVGHTGTLDSFAEGLLVVLSGHLTHLVPHITGFTKTYQAVVCFGKETDTLDPTGAVVSTAAAVSENQLREKLPEFTGALLQVPPVYSAVHVGGKRASDAVRKGAEVQLESRQVFIYKNELLDFKSAGNDGLSYALLEITCSKGTYIRALARDIARSLGSCAHLCALRRTQVGPFLLKDAAGYKAFKDFTIDYGIENAKRSLELQEKKRVTDESVFTDIRSHFLSFTTELALQCGFESSEIKKDAERSYLNGRPLSGSMFNRLTTDKSENAGPFKNKEIAVFYGDGTFGGMVNLSPEHKLFYGFVVPKKQKQVKVFSWNDILNGEFPVEWKTKGSALTVGNFDGMHAGHAVLINAVMGQKNLVKGIVSFTKPGDLIKNRTGSYEGDVFTLQQKIDFCNEKQLDFLVLIDFSDDFSRIDGADFVKILSDSMGMKFMAEGFNFKCGYKGSTSAVELKELSDELQFEFYQAQRVEVENDSVSSSRVRKAVKAGNFSLVQKMLMRSFTYDFRGYSLKASRNLISSDPNLEWFECERTSLQVLPENGVYEVVAVFDDSVLHTSLKISGNMLSILLPSKNMAAGLRTVNFVYKPNVAL